MNVLECKLKNVTVHYVSFGEGTPIIILHGSTLDHHAMVGCMEPIFKYRKGWQRIYLDLPGHGQSSAPEWIRNQDDMLKVILDFIDVMIPHQPFLLVGLSYGGYLARGIIFKRMLDVLGLLLIVPRVVSEIVDRTLPPKTVLVRDEPFLAEMASEEIKEFLDVAVIQTPAHWKRYEPEITTGVKRANHKFLARLYTHGNEFSFDVDSPSKVFNKPTLIITGRQDHWVGYQDAWKLLENYPRATFAVLDRAGHCVQMEQEALFNELVYEWIDRVAESIIE